jgi:hypothetical protein
MSIGVCTTHFWVGFEKTALNATKARALASQYGLVPEGAWKWALRNLRKGKTREQLGQAPKKIVDAIKNKGREVEAGRLWGKGSRGRGRMHIGTEIGVDLGGESKALFKNKAFISAIDEHINGVPPREALKADGRLAKAYKQHVDKTKHLNTIHSHPAVSNASAKEYELDLVRSLRNPDKETQAIIAHSLKDHPLGHRWRKINETKNNLLVSSLEKRYSSSKPELMPSGFKTRSPYNPHGGDQQRFLMGDVGTHHNIVSPGSGVGIHTVRPDKQTGGNRLRSVLFNEKK